MNQPIDLSIINQSVKEFEANIVKGESGRVDFANLSMQLSASPVMYKMLADVYANLMAAREDKVADFVLYILVTGFWIGRIYGRTEINNEVEQ